MALRKVQGGAIADNAITSDKIASGAVTASDIATGAAVPAQTGNAGKYLKTDGTNSSWETVPTPTPTAVSDQANTSTGYFDVPAGTTAQRPVSPSVGFIRYNTDLGFLEQYTGDGWQGIAPPPAITSVSPSTYNGEQGTEFTINGSNFDASVTVKFITSQSSEYSAAIVTRVNNSQLMATTPQDFTVANEPLKVKVINGSGLSYILDNAIDCGGVPTWNTSAGTIATINDAYGSYSPITTISAGDSDVGSTLSYSITSGSLPNNVSLNTSTGAISGDPDNITSQTTYNFTVAATDNAGNQTSRAFSIIVNPAKDGSSSTRAAPSARYIKELTGTTQDNLYWIKTPQMSSAAQIYCDMNNSGGGWMLMWLQQGGPQQTQNTSFYSVLNGSTTNALTPFRYDNSFKYGVTPIWTNNRTVSDVKLMKQYNMYDGTTRLTYSFVDTNPNAGNTLYASSATRQVFDILDLGSSVTPYHIYSNGPENSPTSLANAVTLYIDNGTTGGTYNYGSSATVLASSTSRGFSNNGAPEDQIGSSPRMQSWAARHWIAYSVPNAGQDIIRCQYECWGMNARVEVGIFVKENSTYQPS